MSTSVLHRLTELEDSRDKLRADGRYAEALAVQNNIEALKDDTEKQQLASLLEKHAREDAQLEQENTREFRYFANEWDTKLAAMEKQHQVQEKSLEFQHYQELQAYQARVVKQRPSRTLLDLRCKEAHLKRQCMFKDANEIQAQADALEHQEQLANARAQAASTQVELQKLEAKQRKEMEALQRKQQAAMSEAVVRQKKELQELQRKIQASRVAMLRTQGQERVALEQLFRGWFNPVRLPQATDASLLQAPATPGVASPTSRRPGATQGKRVGAVLTSLDRMYPATTPVTPAQQNQHAWNPPPSYASSTVCSVMSRRAHSMITLSTPSSFSPTGKAAVNKSFTTAYTGKAAAAPSCGGAGPAHQLGFPHDDTHASPAGHQRTSKPAVSVGRLSDCSDNSSLVPALRPKRSGQSIGAAV